MSCTYPGPGSAAQDVQRQQIIRQAHEERLRGNDRDGMER
jgi:hypothetical protein